ncbi:MAG: hypothetical protein ACXWYS_08875 [Gaiellaceae bacterium]
MRRFTLVLLAALALVAAPGAAVVAASPTLRATIIHTLRGCHVWSIAGKPPAPAATVTVKRGTRLAIRLSCPMDFDIAKVRGPALALGPARVYAGTTRTIVFRRPGTFRLRARNVQSSEQVGLQTLGPDNVPTLTVVVR